MPDEFELRPALCLDFDGTIRHSKRGKDFIAGPWDVKVYEGVEEKIWEYKDKGYLIFGITNQGGVAYGMKSEDKHWDEVEAMLRQFDENPFDLIQTSFNHPKGRKFPYNTRSLLRKPDIGMLVLCEDEMRKEGVIVDWDNSIFVGDRPEDEECARNASIAFEWAHEFFGRAG